MVMAINVSPKATLFFMISIVLGLYHDARCLFRAKSHHRQWDKEGIATVALGSSLGYVLML